MQVIFGKPKILHGLSADQMLLDDSFEVLGSTVPIPNAFRIHERDGPSHTHPQAVRLGPKHPASSLAQPEFTQAPLKISPGEYLPLFR